MPNINSRCELVKLWHINCSGAAFLRHCTVVYTRTANTVTTVKSVDLLSVNSNKYSSVYTAS